jgi:hypothetical protein
MDSDYQAGEGFDLLPDLSLTLYLSPLIAEGISNRKERRRPTIVANAALLAFLQSL